MSYCQVRTDTHGSSLNTIAFFTVVFLVNRLPTRALHDISPHELLFKKHPDDLFLWVFVCLYFSHLRAYHSHKLDFRFVPCVLLGYCSFYHGYRCLDVTERIYISRHVSFQEYVFPFADKTSPFLQVKNDATSLMVFLLFDYSLLNNASTIAHSSPNTQQVSGSVQHSNYVHSQQPDTTQSSSSPESMPSIGQSLPSTLDSSAVNHPVLIPTSLYGSHYFNLSHTVVRYVPASSTTSDLEFVLVPVFDIQVPAQSQLLSSSSPSHIDSFPPSSIYYVLTRSNDSTLIAQPQPIAPRIFSHPMQT